MSTAALQKKVRSPAPLDSAQIERFLRETIEAFASPPVTAAILERARRTSGWGEVPAECDELAELFAVHVDQAVRDALGGEVAAAVREPLQRLLLAVAATQREPSVPPAPRPSRVPTVERTGRPFTVVLMLCADRSLCGAIRGRLDARTAVIPVNDGNVLMRDLKVLRQHSRMLVVDRREPNGLLDSIASAPDLLEGTLVALWGATDTDFYVARTLFPGARFLQCDKDTTIEDLATIAKLGPG